MRRLAFAVPLSLPGWPPPSAVSAQSSVTCPIPAGQGAVVEVPATIVGTEGVDVIRGTDGPDVIAGLGGDDVIFGLGGDDLICGGAGGGPVGGGGGDRNPLRGNG